VGKFINKEKKMENVEVRWVKSNKDGEYYKVGPDHSDYERWGLTIEDLVKESNALWRAIFNIKKEAA
jgi:hypothetical protein